MSYLYKLRPLMQYLPTVTTPKYRVSFNDKLKWTAIVLLVFYILTEIPLFGLSPAKIDYFESMRAVISGKFGSIITLGIGPIVTASIVMQLLAGSKMIDLDLSKEEDRKIFQGTQKLLAILFTVLEAVPWVVMGGLPPDPSLGINLRLLEIILIAQLTLGAIVIIYLDEVVSKWGIGSGVGLFIAAGVASQIFIGSLNPLSPRDMPGEPSGAIPAFIHSLMTGSPTLVRGGLPDMLAVFSTIFVFLLVVYAESMRIEVPLSHGRVRGARGRYPIRLIYTSNIPVILAAALFANIQLWARILQGIGYPILGSFGSSGAPTSGLVWWLTPQRTLAEDILLGTVTLPDIGRSLFYLASMILFCTIFAKFWVETTGMGPKDIAKQLSESGMLIPGFRRDVRVIEKILDRYIPPVAIMGGAFVGFLAAFADFTGALGGGTGVLLTVGIVYRLYEEIASEQLMEMHPAIRQFFET
ncbi:MAG: preprotein translocase subunit SecY [Candidatus Hydrothermarchaeota archaeon]